MKRLTKMTLLSQGKYLTMSKSVYRKSFFNDVLLNWVIYIFFNLDSEDEGTQTLIDKQVTN